MLLNVLTIVSAHENAGGLAPARRYALEDAHDVIIGRGEVAGDSRQIADGRVEIRVDVVDARMSADHARISCEGKQWVVADLGSRNRAFVNGAQIEGRYLAEIFGYSSPIVTGEPRELEMKIAHDLNRQIDAAIAEELGAE